MLHGPNVASMPPAWAIARTAAAASGTSGFTPHLAQTSTVFGGVGAAALADDDGTTAMIPSHTETTSATEHRDRLIIPESLEVCCQNS